MILLDPLARPVIAHRGASGRFPENTLKAFREASVQGADAFELDVRLTRDGIPVVIHDATVDRTTDGRGAVARLTLEQVHALDAGQGEQVPTLAHVFEEFPNTPVIVDIKTLEGVPTVGEIVRRMGARDRVLVGSFLYRAVRLARARGFATAASRPEVSVFWGLSRVGFALPLASRAFTAPEYSGRLRVVDPRFVRGARRRGWPVHVWTIDDAPRARALRSIGVAGIMTNFPERIVGSC